MKNNPNTFQPTYSDSFKLGVVRRVANGELTKEQARLDFGIGGNSAILEWMRKFGYYSDPPTHPLMKKPTTSSDDPEQLKKRIRKLEQPVQTELICSEFYKTMIDVLNVSWEFPFEKVRHQSIRLIRRSYRVSMSRIAQWIGVSRQAIYSSQKRFDQCGDLRETIIGFVQVQRLINKAIGGVKLHQCFIREYPGETIGRDRFLDVLRTSGLLLRRRRAPKMALASVAERAGRQDLAHKLSVAGPGHLWVQDDTEVVIMKGKGHLALSTDAYSRKVVRYSWSPPSRPDRNPIAERINSTFKQEYLCDSHEKSFEQIKQELPIYIRHYNEARPHMSCGNSYPS